MDGDLCTPDSPELDTEQRLIPGKKIEKLLIRLIENGISA